MELVPRLVPAWPKLAWVAVFAEGADEIDVYHGPAVEVSDKWIAEAVWAGEFESGDFDRTDLVVGTGVRCRGDRVIFVSSGTAMDRLWYCQRNGAWYVSNSLGALSACADLAMLEGHSYVRDRRSTMRTTWGADSYVRSFPTKSGEANLVWFKNLIYDGHAFREVDKPDVAPHFGAFDEYRDYLFDGARRLGVNLRSPARRHKVTALASVSSGYDSPAVAVVAKHAGCERAVTIRQATSFWRGSDSGEEIAEHLGLTCRSYDRTAPSYPNEEAFWAASGYCNLLGWTQFEYPQPVCLFFVGCYGDEIWDRKKMRDPFTIDIWDDLAMGEFRLFAGMLQCVVPFWGMRHAEEIQDITFSQEMQPWTLHDDYDRPIARRIVEEAGVPRGSFAVRKKNTSHEAAFRWPYSPESQASFGRYLKDRGLYAPGPLAVWLLRRLAHIEALVHSNTMRWLGVRKRFRPWLKLAGTRLLFQWANQELKQYYREGLEEPLEDDS